MKKFIEQYAKSICGTISGWDRVRFRGTIRWLASTRGINTYLGSTGILLKDFKKWAEPITEKVRKSCELQAKQMDVPMIYLPSASINKPEFNS